MNNIHNNNNNIIMIQWLSSAAFSRRLGATRIAQMNMVRGCSTQSSDHHRGTVCRQHFTTKNCQLTASEATETTSVRLID